MAKMKSRERLGIALSHREPDRVPVDFGGVHTSLHDYAHQNLMKYYNFQGSAAKIQDTLQQIVFPDEKILDKYISDVRGIYSHSSSAYEFVLDTEKDEWFDEWGNRFVRPEDGFFYDVKEHVMADFSLDDLRKFKVPDPSDKGRTIGLRDEALKIRENTDKAIILYNASWGLWENLWLMRGYEQAYIDIGINEDFVDYFWDMMLDWQKGYWGTVLDEVGDLVDVIQLGDDLGTQRGPVFNPETYRSRLKPRHKEIVDFIKSRTEAKVYIHSCGSVKWVIPDFIDCGIDILNPVQVGADNMDSKILKAEFGKDIIFWGGGCDPNVLLEKKPQDVSDEVKRRIDDFAPGGGFVFASIHNIQANTPPENIAAMYETAVEYGKY